MNHHNSGDTAHDITLQTQTHESHRGKERASVYRRENVTKIASMTSSHDALMCHWLVIADAITPITDLRLTLPSMHANSHRFINEPGVQAPGSDQRRRGAPLRYDFGSHHRA